MVFKTLFKLHEGFKTVEQRPSATVGKKEATLDTAGSVCWKGEAATRALAIASHFAGLPWRGLWQLQGTLLGCLGDSSTLLAEQLSLFWFNKNFENGRILRKIQPAWAAPSLQEKSIEFFDPTIQSGELMWSFSGQNCYLLQSYPWNFKGPNFLSCCLLKFFRKKQRLLCRIIELYSVGVDSDQLSHVFQLILGDKISVFCPGSKTFGWRTQS